MSIRCFLAPLLCVLLAPVPRAQDSAAAPASTPVLMLRLRDGSIQWGSIQAHDPTGIVFQRLDNGGILRLAWSRLDPAEERGLRQDFGYIDTTTEEVLVTADRLMTVRGVELIGKILDRTADTILLKTASTTIPVPKNQIAGASEVVQVPAREVYTLEELYAAERSNHDLATATGNLNLARYCERLFDFPRAIEHYQKALELGPGERKAEVELSLGRAREKAKAAAELEYLAEIDHLTKRKKFDEALQKAEQFKERFPSSALFADAKTKRDRVIKARTEFLGTEIARLYQFHVSRLAREAASKTLEETMAYLDEKLKTDVIAASAKDAAKISKEATEDTVRTAWKNRKKVRYQTASYGLGTWLLGKAAALKGYEEDPQAEAPQSEVDKQRADLASKIKKFLQAQEVARSAQSNEEQKDDRESAWRELSPGARAHWILAYYVENSGDFELYTKPLIQACKQCGGKGIVEFALAGANVSQSAVGKPSNDLKAECETCHGIGAVRRIQYR